jgi:hypothetical protein
VSQNGGLGGEGVILGFLCYRFSRALDRDVIDKTGLAGIYDVHMTPTSVSATEGGEESESGQRLAEFIAIDHVEKPSENWPPG